MFIEAKDDGSGGDNWSYKSCKAPVKSSLSTNQHPVFLQARCPSCRPTNSVSQSIEGKNITFHGPAYPMLTWGSSNFVSDRYSFRFNQVNFFFISCVNVNALKSGWIIVCITYWLLHRTYVIFIPSVVLRITWENKIRKVLKLRWVAEPTEMSLHAELYTCAYIHLFYFRHKVHSLSVDR